VQVHDKNHIGAAAYAAYDKKTAESGCRALNAVSQMEVNDLVWTRFHSIYYLCRVIGLWENRVITQPHIDHDVANYVQVEWVEVGTVDEVPGKVVNSFRAAAAAQKVLDVEQISKIIWNVKTQLCAWKMEVAAGVDVDFRKIEREITHHVGNGISNNGGSGALTPYQYPTQPLSRKDFWNNISAEDIEELVLLYLQTQGYYLHTSTLKRDTADIECVMIKNDGSHRLYVQVKSGSVALNPIDYKHLTVHGDRVALFTSCQKYGPGVKDVRCISPEDLEDFVEKNLVILPSKIRYWWP
jgi:hypothetical protein